MSLSLNTQHTLDFIQCINISFICSDDSHAAYCFGDRICSSNRHNIQGVRFGAADRDAFGTLDREYQRKLHSCMAQHSERADAR